MWPSLLPALALLATGLVAGWVNTLAGAGGLIAIPALIFSGLDIHSANGTLRLAIIAQSVVGVVAFRSAGRLPWQPLRSILPVVIVGGAFGAWSATALGAKALTIVELVVMGSMAFGLLVRVTRFLPPEGAAVRELSLGSGLALFAAGFYGGLVQAGVGLLLVVVLCGLLRFDLVRGNAIKLASTLAFNVVGLAIFVHADQVRWRPGVLLAAGMAGGALLGVRFAVRRGQEAVRWVIIVAVLGATFALAWREL